MNNKEADILQIKAYLNGELNARAMHELEKRAQEDPLLMDALEGYEAAKAQPEQVSADLQRRLHQRLNEDKQRALLPWRTVASAATIILVSGAGLWWYLSQQKPQQMAVVPVTHVQPRLSGADSVPKAAAVPADSVMSVPHVSGPAVASVRRPLKAHHVDEQAGVNATVQAEVVDILKNVPAAVAMTPYDSTPANPVQTYARRKMVILGEGKKIPTIKPDSQQLITQQLQGKVAGVEVEPNAGQHMIEGKLLNGINGQPLIGAQVRVKDLPNSTLTDREGNFRITAHDKDVLVLSSAGYESREVNAGRKDSLSVSMQPASSSLSEVVVMNYGMHSKAESKAAEPLMGWQAYKSYLEHAQSPDGKTGTVKLSITVNPNGSLADFTILSGLTDAANEAAISLIKKGPAWRGNPGGKPEQVNLKIKFR